MYPDTASLEVGVGRSGTSSQPDIQVDPGAEKWHCHEMGSLLA